MIKLYLVFVWIFFTLPSVTRSNSTKSVSSKSVINFLDNERVIFNLSAPGAAKLVNPFALSYKDGSSFALTKDSVTFNPTL